MLNLSNHIVFHNYISYIFFYSTKQFFFFWIIMNEKLSNFGSRIAWKMVLWPILMILFSKTHSKISILAKYKKVLLWKYIVLTYFLHAYKTYLFYLSNLISCFKSYILQWVNQSIVSLLSNIKIKKKKKYHDSKYITSTISFIYAFPAFNNT